MLTLLKTLLQLTIFRWFLVQFVTELLLWIEYKLTQGNDYELFQKQSLNKKGIDLP